MLTCSSLSWLSSLAKKYPRHILRDQNATWLAEVVRSELAHPRNQRQPGASADRDEPELNADGWFVASDSDWSDSEDDSDDDSVSSGNTL